MQWRDYIRTYWRFTCYIWRRFTQDGCSYRAAALTFTSLLSLVPLMAVSFAIITAFPVFQAFEKRVQDFIFSNFVPASGQAVQHQLQLFASQASNLSGVGMLFLVITAVLVMFTIEQAFNAIWHVPTRRKGTSAFLLYWAVLTLAPILMGISLAVSSYLISLPLVTGTAQSLGLLEPMLALVPFLASWVTFTFLYVAVPNCYVPIRHGLGGAFIAAILFEVAKKGFAFYVTHFPTYKLLYGALATIPIFLVWLYVSWLIILFGAEVANSLSYHRNFVSGRQFDGFTQAFRWLGYLWRAQREGKGLSLPELINQDPDDYTVSATIQLQSLLHAKLIQRTAGERYILSRDLTTLSLVDLYRLMPWQLPDLEKLAVSQTAWDQALIAALQPAVKQITATMDVSLVSLYR